MFKFMKSKKGFTLVELMIVVVIMAILVAVAVPIYNAVTENARKKTCATNRRNIISQITNNVMSQPNKCILSAGSSATFTVTTDAEGGAVAADGIDGADGVFSGGENTFKAWFNDKNQPICPSKSGVLTITVKADKSDASSLQVTVSCSTEGHAA